MPKSISIFRSGTGSCTFNITQNSAVTATFAPDTCVNPPSGLIAWWRAENNANDSVGTNHGTMMNGATFAAGKVGQAFSFDGVDDYVTTNLVSTATDNVSIDVWVKWGGPNAGNTLQRIFYNGHSGYDGYGLFVMPDRTLNLLIGGVTLIETGIELTQDVWHHVAFMRENGTWKLYLDATELSLNDTSPRVPTTGTFIGGILDYGIPYEIFKGLIDEVGIFNRALTAEEIQAIYNAGSAGKCFTPTPQYTLTVTRAGTGAGTVTSSPSGINCGSTCTASFDSGTSVTLTATPASGSTFGGWFGGTGSASGCTGTGDCTFNITEDSEVTAIFSPTGTPKISASPMAVNFRSLKVGTEATRTVTVKNTGKSDLIFYNIGITGTNAAEFNINSSTCNLVLPPLGTCTISVTFKPAIPFGKKSALLTISSKDPKKPTINVKLFGIASPPKIVVKPRAINFGKLSTATEKTVTITNKGISDLEVYDLEIKDPLGNLSTEFTVSDNTCDDAPIAKDGSCTITLQFTPTEPVGKKTAVLSIPSNDPKKTVVKVKLTGIKD